MTQRPWVAGAVAITWALTLTGCDKLKATTDRALASLSFRKDPCPFTARTRAAGTEKHDQALACFQYAIAKKDSERLLRVTCQGKTPASCEHNDSIRRQAQEGMASLASQSWTNVLGEWKGPNQEVIYAVDTNPNGKNVTKVVLYRAVEGKRWAICEVGELPRDALPAFAVSPKEKKEEHEEKSRATTGNESCPAPVSGRVAGGTSAEQVLECFQEGMHKRSTELLLRVTCQGKTSATCTISDKTTRDAERVFHDLFELSWSKVVSHWKASDKADIYAIDTRPTEKRVHTISICHIANDDRWAICELSEMSREAAVKKGTQRP